MIIAVTGHGQIKQRVGMTIAERLWKTFRSARGLSKRHQGAAVRAAIGTGRMRVLHEALLERVGLLLALAFVRQQCDFVCWLLCACVWVGGWVGGWRREGNREGGERGEPRCGHTRGDGRC
jgi:hypothetical protein